MQTFLPYHPIFNDNTGEWSFANTAEVLDKKRLNKQVVEASQILEILCGRYADARFRNHPAVLQWTGHEWVLLDYLNDLCMEAKARLIQCSILDKIGGYMALMPGNASQELPEWMERPDIFASHRSRLLFKGRCDSALDALRKVVKLPKGISIRFWLISDDSSIVVSNEYVRNQQMQARDIEQIEDYLYERKADIATNYYRQFKWKETDTIPIVWPVTIAAKRQQAEMERIERIKARENASPIDR